MKKKGIIGIVIVLFIGLGLYFMKDNSEAGEQQTTKFSYFKYFDTVIDVVIYEDADESIEGIVENRLKELHTIASSFDSESTLYDLNRNGQTAYNAELAKLLQYGIDYYNNYSKEFNIALGPVIDVWKKYLENCNENKICEVPSQNELNLAARNIDPNNIVIANEGISIASGMKIDLGGIAKGYAADQIGILLKEEGYEYYLINAGGNILVSEKPNGDDYIIAVVNPTNNTKSFINLHITNNAVVTSGDYERFYEVNGVRYSHLISNKTFYPSRDFRSVTVITKSSMEADIWTTLLFNTDIETGLKLVERTDGIEAIWYISDSEVYKSTGISEYEKK